MPVSGPSAWTATRVLGPHVLRRRLLKSFEAGFAEVLRQVEAELGLPRRPRRQVLTMRDGSAGLGRISPKVPRSLVAQVEELRPDRAGTVRVPGVAVARHAE